MKRKPLSKKIRFEVFKRDLFTCQYCGKKAPDVVLNIDHINPVKEGGENDIFNLLTSCFDCNAGKSARKLDDNSVLIKQRNQIELIEERKQQILLLIEWKKSVSNINEDFVEIIINYINSKIYPLTFDNGKIVIEDWLRKYSVEDILENVDQSALKNLRYHSDEVFQESVGIFISKIGAFLSVSKMNPIQKKIRYINGIGRNRIYNWNEKISIIILNKYCNSLVKRKWTDDAIVDDLECEICTYTSNSRNWFDWRNQMESWIENIENWEQADEFEKIIAEMKDEDEKCSSIGFEKYLEENEELILNNKIKDDREIVYDNLIFIEFITKDFQDFNIELFKIKHNELIIRFLEFLKSSHLEKKCLEENYLFNHYFYSDIRLYFQGDLFSENRLFEIIKAKVTQLILENLDVFDFSQTNMDFGEILKIINIQLEYYKKIQLS